MLKVLAPAALLAAIGAAGHRHAAGPGRGVRRGPAHPSLRRLRALRPPGDLRLLPSGRPVGRLRPRGVMPGRLPHRSLRPPLLAELNQPLL